MMAQDIVRGGGLLYPGDLAVSQLLHPVNGLLHFPALVGIHQLNQMQYQVVLLPLGVATIIMIITLYSARTDSYTIFDPMMSKKKEHLSPLS